jgi:hypothetical protein
MAESTNAAAEGGEKTSTSSGQKTSTSSEHRDHQHSALHHANGSPSEKTIIIAIDFSDRAEQAFNCTYACPVTDHNLMGVHFTCFSAMP